MAALRQSLGDRAFGDHVRCEARRAHRSRYYDEAGRYRMRWLPEKVVKGVAYDTPVPGYRVPTTNLLRLWKAEAAESFDFEAFNVGDYYRAVDEKIASETISKVLYPNDEPEAGKQLRLAQQYFFVSCSLQDMIRLLMMRGKPLHEFHSYWAAQLNDTHPSIAVAELMRLLVDEHAMEWDQAWAITQQTCGYTNHTLLAEALERWPLPLFARLLPRHLEIIYEINRRFLDDIRLRYPSDDQLLRRLSLIDEAGDKYIRMAHLASVGSHAINGVAALHTELLKQTVLSDFHRVAPEKFFNVTNGVTPRRWIALSNPELERADHPAYRRPMDSGFGARARTPRAAGRRTATSRRIGKPSRPITNVFWRASSRSEPASLVGSALALRHPGEAAARVQAPAPERLVPGHSLQQAQA